MNLLLDLGNSRIKWALAQGSNWLREGAAAGIDELDQAWSSFARPDRVFGCAVTSTQDQMAIAARVSSLWQRNVAWLQPDSMAVGVRNSYQFPQRLGPDRWAALIGARNHFPDTALVVVSAGTALVVDALDRQGVFLGGMILPGYRLMKTALAGNTARLPLTEGSFADFPTNTEDAIETGCLSALHGAITSMHARLQARCDTPVRIILSGGDAPRLLPLFQDTASIVDNLALHGLAAWAASTGDNAS